MDDYFLNNFFDFFDNYDYGSKGGLFVQEQVEEIMSDIMDKHDVLIDINLTHDIAEKIRQLVVVVLRDYSEEVRKQIFYEVFDIKERLNALEQKKGN